MTTANDATVFSHYVTTPLGRLLLESDGDALTAICLPTPVTSPHTSPPTTPPRVTQYRRGVPEVLRTAQRQLDEYFSHERTTFDLATNVSATAFQRNVWNQLTLIPYGTTITYAELARRVGSPQGYRAVGQANKRNPLPIVVPCHRVVASGNLGGYAGGLTLKRALLELEGALG